MRSCEIFKNDIITNNNYLFLFGLNRNNSYICGEDSNPFV
nr:MAG TPA: hypothetical protein [Caudoviricetes sp.]